MKKVEPLSRDPAYLQASDYLSLLMAPIIHLFFSLYQ